ncbi:LOW QUALITY PROTEIN: hypothetical protein TMLG_02379, partial [Mycobacterium tuberculosis SUMu012]
NPLRSQSRSTQCI